MEVCRQSPLVQDGDMLWDLWDAAMFLMMHQGETRGLPMACDAASGACMGAHRTASFSAGQASLHCAITSPDIMSTSAAVGAPRPARAHAGRLQHSCTRPLAVRSCRQWRTRSTVGDQPAETLSAGAEGGCRA
jgi:hypothetical protein